MRTAAPKSPLLLYPIDIHPDESIEVNIVLDGSLNAPFPTLPLLRRSYSSSIIWTRCDHNVHEEIDRLYQTGIDQACDREFVVHRTLPLWILFVARPHAFLDQVSKRSVGRNNLVVVLLGEVRL